jgi:hypothetical protein
VATAWTENVLYNCLGLRPGERVLALVDEPLRQAGEALCATVGRLGRCVVLPRPGALSVVPTRLMREAAAADVVVALVSALDLGQEPAGLRSARAALRPEARWALGAFITPDVLEHELAADCHAVAEATAAVARRLNGVEQVHISTAAGTDLTFRLGGRPIWQDTGLLTAPGARGNLPAGEAFVAPLEESAEGRLVVDGSLGDIPLDGPVTLTFRRGQVVDVAGGSAAAELERRLQAEPGARSIAEFGVGTNPHARLRGRAMLDEKVQGTVHVAIGGNRSFGGTNDAAAHYDCVILSPHVMLDGQPL